MSLKPSALLLAALLAAFALAPPRALRAQDSGPPAEAPPADPRAVRADELLGERAHWPEAIALYEAALADAPGDAELRVRLARVLAWDEQYPRALAEYERLLAAQPQRRELRLEQAEVLSWAGEYARALDGFDRVLREDPRDARALRGRARTQRWAGRLGEADEAYARALELEEDPEARAEWQELRAALRPDAKLALEDFSDSAHFTRRAAALRLSAPLGFGSRVLGRLATLDIAHPQRDVATAARSSFASDRALELALGLERAWGERLRGDLELGARDWQHGGDAPFGRAALSLDANGRTSLGLYLERSDFSDASYSFEAVEHDVRQSAAALTLWRQLSTRFSTFGRAELADVSDGNTRRALSASLSYQPWPARVLYVHLGASVLEYARASENYYDPKYDQGVELALEQRFTPATGLELDYRVALGLQRSAERSAGGALEQGSGVLGAAEAGARWSRGPWALALRGALSYSPRGSRYRTARLQLQLERTF